MCSVLGNSRLPDVCFRMDGRISITAKVVSLLGIEEGDVIDIWSEDEEQLLYVLRHNGDASGRHTAVCKCTNKKRKFMRVWCVKLCRHILSLTGGRKEAHLYVGELVSHPRIGKALPLITRNNLYNEDE